MLPIIILGSLAALAILERLAPAVIVAARRILPRRRRRPTARREVRSTRRRSVVVRPRDDFELWERELRRGRRIDW